MKRTSAASKNYFVVSLRIVRQHQNFATFGPVRECKKYLDCKCTLRDCESDREKSKRTDRACTNMCLSLDVNDR